MIRRGVAIALTALALVDARLGWFGEGPRVSAAPIARLELVDLKSAAALRQQFNADRGNTRLLLLLSPT